MQKLLSFDKPSRAASRELILVKIVARLTPWFAPFPSAYFVARSSMEHLQIPLVVAIVVAAIIEFLGLTSVHTWLWLSDWNTRKRKTDPVAPAKYAFVLGLVYLVATIGLTIFLEVIPELATYAPGIFPALALVGAFNLALIAQQEHREIQAGVERDERRTERSNHRSSDRLGDRSDKQSERHAEPVQFAVQDALNDGTGVEKPMTARRRSGAARRTSREEALNALALFFENNPGASYSTAGNEVQRSKTWVAGAVVDLEKDGRLRRNGQGIEVIR